MRSIKKSTTVVKEKETDILRAVCDYLQMRKSKGYLFWRANNIGMYDGKDYRPLPKYSMLGVPDINLIYNGQYIGLEVKTKVGTQSDNQKEFERRCREAGAEYYIIRSVNDVIDLGL